MARPRAVLAALCLADEPNVSEEIAHEALHRFAEQIGKNDGLGSVRTSLDAAAMELAGSRWRETVHSILVEEFCRRRRDSKSWIDVGGLCMIWSWLGAYLGIGGEGK